MIHKLDTFVKLTEIKEIFLFSAAWRRGTCYLIFNWMSLITMGKKCNEIVFIIIKKQGFHTFLMLHVLVHHSHSGRNFQQFNIIFKW